MPSGEEPSGEAPNTEGELDEQTRVTETRGTIRVNGSLHQNVINLTGDDGALIVIDLSAD